MSEAAPRYVTCPCQHCNGRLEFDANQRDSTARTFIACPHCGLETVIFVPPTQPENQTSRIPPVIVTARSSEKQSEAGLQYYNQVLSVLQLDPQITPATVEGFAGQDTIKRKAGSAFEEAQKHGQKPPHILLIGPPGSGKTSLALLIARAFANSAETNYRASNARCFGEIRDFAEFLSSIRERDVFFLDDIDFLTPTVASFIPSAVVDFNFDIGSWLVPGVNSPELSVPELIVKNLPRSLVGNISKSVVELAGYLGTKPSTRPAKSFPPEFTFIATATKKDRLSPLLLACFPVVLELDAYSTQGMVEVTSRLVENLGLQFDEDAIELVASHAEGSPKTVAYLLELVRVYAQARSASKRITLELATATFESLFTDASSEELDQERRAIPSAVRREVWRRDEGKCTKCGSRVNLEYDHIVPVAKGGSNTARNIELLCESCNRAKSDSIL